MSPAAPTPLSNPLDELWQAGAILWIVLGGEGLAAALAMAPGIDFDRWIYFGLASLWVQWLSLLSLGALYAARHWLGGRSPAEIGAAALLAALACNWLLVGLARLAFGPDGLSYQMDWWGLGLRASGITLAVGLLGLAAFHNYWRGRMLMARTKQAELEALQARIRPHFLFNTLNTGAALVHARPGEAERLLLDLADLFRAALSGPRELPLAEELALARRYLEIESLRFGSRLRLSWNMPENIPAVLIPTLSIQPLVENAVRHGVEPSGDGGAVDVTVRLDTDVIRVIISNDLPPSGTQASSGHKVGLVSARERIIALTQGRGRLDTTVSDGRYVATITLPYP
jgi:two-component system sensor histidine kinase AlgZ